MANAANGKGENVLDYNYLGIQDILSDDIELDTKRLLMDDYSCAMKSVRAAMVRGGVSVDFPRSSGEGETRADKVNRLSKLFCDADMITDENLDITIGHARIIKLTRLAQAMIDDLDNVGIAQFLAPVIKPYPSADAEKCLGEGQYKK